MSANPLAHNPIDDAELPGFTGEIQMTLSDSNQEIWFDLFLVFAYGDLTSGCTIDRYQVEHVHFTEYSEDGQSEKTTFKKRNSEIEQGDHVAALIKLLISGPELVKLAQKHELMVVEQGLGPDFDLRETWA